MADKHPSSIEVNTQKIVSVLTLLGLLLTGYFWAGEFHSKYATKDNVNLIYIDLQIDALEFRLRMYDDGDGSLNESQQRRYSSNSDRLNELKKSRGKIVGTGG